MAATRIMRDKSGSAFNDHSLVHCNKSEDELDLISIVISIRSWTSLVLGNNAKKSAQQCKQPVGYQEVQKCPEMAGTRLRVSAMTITNPNTVVQFEKHDYQQDIPYPAIYLGIVG